MTSIAQNQGNDQRKISAMLKKFLRRVADAPLGSNHRVRPSVSSFFLT